MSRTRSISARVVKKIDSEMNRIRGLLVDLLHERDERYAIARIGSGVRLSNAILKGENGINEGVRLIGNVTLGYGSTLGQRCTIWAGSSEIVIGNYCQIAPFVSMYTTNHPVSYLTTYVNQTLFDGRLGQHARSSPIHIGHDIWIGHGAIVLQGVTVGNGAIIGAGAVVTSDVPAYGIMAGNPARLIRYRFDQRLIEALQHLQWWNRTSKQLDAYEPLFQVDLNADIEHSLVLIKSYGDK